MDIKYFKEKFVDWIDECSELGKHATIQVQDSCYFGNHWWGVVDKCTVSDGIAILNVTEYENNVEYRFTDKSLFNDVNKVYSASMVKLLKIQNGLIPVGVIEYSYLR